jgi:hypothetical protein
MSGQSLSESSNDPDWPVDPLLLAFRAAQRMVGVVVHAVAFPAAAGASRQHHTTVPGIVRIV